VEGVLLFSASSASLRLPAKLENLTAIRRFVDETAAGLGIDRATVADIVLAVDEAASNVVLHGYRGQPGSLEVEVKRGRNALVICLRDEAPPFDPTTVPAPDLAAPLEQQAVDGMGMHLIRQIMDSVIHRTSPQGGNELLLVKRLEENSEDFDICD
jgi:serine/threonine-protein kinase RsbW